MKTVTIKIDFAQINQLDLTPVKEAIEPWLNQGQEAIKQREQEFIFTIDYPREEGDPRELSEIPQIRLWFLRLDSRYPWFPYCLDWKAELARYIAMLVPHQFHRVEGIQYNPEALEICITQKLFIISDWLKEKGISSPAKLKAMAQVLGYEFDDIFLEKV